jgi:hypothetical protein
VAATYDPFAEVPRGGIRSRALLTEPGSALVTYRRGTVRTYVWPAQPPRPGLTGGMRFDKIYRVDMRPHRLKWWLAVPCKGGAFDFETEIEAMCRVVGPGAVVEADAHDPSELLKPSIARRIRGFGQGFDIEQSADAETRIGETLGVQTVVESGFQLDQFDVQLRLDKDARRHVAELRRMERASDRRLKAAELDAKLRQEERRELRVGVDFYNELIDKGASSIWAMQLARHPEAIPDLIERIQAQDDSKQALLRGVFDVILKKSDIEERDVRDDLLLLWRSMIRALDTPGKGTPVDARAATAVAAPDAGRPPANTAGRTPPEHPGSAEPPPA